MIGNVLIAATVAATVVASTPPAARVAEDARVIDRVAEMSRRDLPRDLLKRMIELDLDLLRGKRVDGTYEHASFERMEAGRVVEALSVRPRRDAEELDKVEIKGDFVYRLVVEIPSRRMVVTRNRRLWVDRIEIEAVPIGGSVAKVQTVRMGAWLEPGATRVVELDEVARAATARVHLRADKESGYGNITLTLVQARVFDNADSPYAAAVASAKALQRAIENEDVPSIRSMASRLHAELRGTVSPPAAAGSSVDVVASTAAATTAMPAPAPPNSDIYTELLAIEDLLTGSEAEKREGSDRLHQLIRRLRPR